MIILHECLVWTLALLAIPASLASAYLLLLTVLSGKLPAPPRSQRRTCFDVIVPAHDEAEGIARTLADLQALDWPRDRYRILVVADNCTDDTAAIAASCGAVVLERRNLTERGKGYALRFAFERSLAQGWADALVVIDADSKVSSNLLEAFAWRIERGATALQAHHGVLATGAWRARLLAIAFSAYHVVRSRARERLGVSCGIRGNGWCVTRPLLREVPYGAFSLAEDMEFGIDLGLAGHRVHYAGEACANQEMVSDARKARSQRRRWEQGRFDLIRGRTAALLRAALRRRDAVCLDLALDLLIPPLAYVVLIALAWLALATMAAALGWVTTSWLWASAACALSLAVYVLRGWQLSGTGARGLLDLAAAPVFIAWKIVLMLRTSRQTAWIRTSREKLT